MLHTGARTGRIRHEPRGEIQALCSGSQFPAKPSPLLGPHGSPMLQKLVFEISLRTSRENCAQGCPGEGRAAGFHGRFF